MEAVLLFLSPTDLTSWKNGVTDVMGWCAQELAVEAMMLLPSRLAELLPYLPRAMPALVQALGGKHELVALVGLRLRPRSCPRPPWDNVEYKHPVSSVDRALFSEYLTSWYVHQSQQIMVSGAGPGTLCPAGLAGRP